MSTEPGPCPALDGDGIVGSADTGSHLASPSHSDADNRQIV